MTDQAPLQPALTLDDSIAAYELACLAESVRSRASLVASGTWNKYERRAAELARRHPRSDPYATYLSKARTGAWSSRNARQADRSALVRLAARDVLEAMPIVWRERLTRAPTAVDRTRIIDRLRGVVTPEVFEAIQSAAEPLARDDHRALVRAARFLLAVPPDPYHTRVRAPSGVRADSGSSGTASRRSGKDLLVALNRHTRRKRKADPAYDWRSRFWTAAVLPDGHLDDDQRACLAALMLTGCRPAELAEDLGVEVAAIGSGETPGLAFRIRGAKTDRPADDNLPARGQAIREIALRCASPEALWLHGHLWGLGEATARLTWPTPERSATGVILPPAERHRRVSVSLGKRVERLGRIAFPRLTRPLTPYAFRHAIAAEMKASGAFSEAEIATALGHLSARTQQHYGSAASSRGLGAERALQITTIRAADPVRGAREHYTPEGPAAGAEGA